MAIALLVLLYAAVSRRLSGSVITPAIVFVAGGLLVSEEGLGWLDPTIQSEFVRVVAEATLTLVLFSDASRIDLPALRREIALPSGCWQSGCRSRSWPARSPAWASWGSWC